MSRYFTASTNVTVDHGRPPRVFTSDSGITFALVESGDGSASVGLHAATPGALYEWLCAAAAAVERLIEPVLPLDDVPSTPEAVQA